MHDPMTVVFTIPNPFASRYTWAKTWWKRPSLITIWHVDPERDGNDDSCGRDYQFKKLTPQEKAIADAIWDGETIFDNRPHYPNSPEHRWFKTLKRAWLEHRQQHTFWRVAPRWHIWHWRIQIHPLESLRRRLLTRCESCGKRLGTSPAIAVGWDSPPRRWFELFRGQRGLMHEECAREQTQAGKQT